MKGDVNQGAGFIQVREKIWNHKRQPNKMLSKVEEESMEKDNLVTDDLGEYHGIKSNMVKRIMSLQVARLTPNTEKRTDWRIIDGIRRTLLSK